MNGEGSRIEEQQCGEYRFQAPRIKFNYMEWASHVHILHLGHINSDNLKSNLHLSSFPLAIPDTITRAYNSKFGRSPTHNLGVLVVS